jgi:DNA-binding transcriptional regulator GbsR (MarR family)
MKPIENAVQEMIEAGGRSAQSFGFNRLLGQIYFLLFLSKDPLSLNDMMEKLGVSKASVSISSRQLLSWGLIQRVWKKGDRKDYYTAETDFGHLLNNGLLDTFKKKLMTAQTHIEKSLEMMEQCTGDDPAEKEFIKKRLLEAEKYRNRMNKLINNPLVRKLI